LQITSFLPPPLLSALAIVTFTFLPFEFQGTSPRAFVDQPISETVEDRDSQNLMRSLAPITDQDIQVAVERSLFLPLRHPWEEVVVEAEPILEIEQTLEVPEPSGEAQPQVFQEPDVLYLGVVTTSNSSRALISLGIERNESWVETGAAIGDWSVVEIRAEAILLTAGEQEVVVKLQQ